SLLWLLQDFPKYSGGAGARIAVVPGPIGVAPRARSAVPRPAAPVPRPEAPVPRPAAPGPGPRRALSAWATGTVPRSSTLGPMPHPDEIKQRIEASIPGARADVEDYSGGGDHFRATVTAAAFQGLSRRGTPGPVYGFCGERTGGPPHPLPLKTNPPETPPTP